MSARAHMCTPWLVATLPSVVTTSRTMLPLAALVVVSTHENMHTCLAYSCFSPPAYVHSHQARQPQKYYELYTSLREGTPLRAFPDGRKKVILNYLLSYAALALQLISGMWSIGPDDDGSARVRATGGYGNYEVGSYAHVTCSCVWCRLWNCRVTICSRWLRKCQMRARSPYSILGIHCKSAFYTSLFGLMAMVCPWLLTESILPQPKSWKRAGRMWWPCTIACKSVAHVSAMLIFHWNRILAWASASQIHTHSHTSQFLCPPLRSFYWPSTVKKPIIRTPVCLLSYDFLFVVSRSSLQRHSQRGHTRVRLCRHWNVRPSKLWSVQLPYRWDKLLTGCFLQKRLCICACIGDSGMFWWKYVF